MRQSSIAFDTKGLTLEGVVASPVGASGSLPGVVVCHPHPLFGGSMDNPLVLGVCQALVDEDFVALRFNFRGVGKSEGSFTGGEKEPEDVRAALGLLEQWPGVNRRRLGLVGYSFGASMVLTALASYRTARAFAIISPPLASLGHSGLGKDKRAKLFIVGDKDRVVPHLALEEKIGALSGAHELWVVPGADHTWRGYEQDVALRTARFFSGTLRR